MKIKKKNFSKQNVIKEFIILLIRKNLPKISIRAIEERIVRERKNNKELIDIFSKICINARLYREISIPLIKEFVRRLDRVTTIINSLNLNDMATKRGRCYLKQILNKKLNKLC